MQTVDVLRKEFFEKMKTNGIWTKLPDPAEVPEIPYQLIKINKPDLPYYTGHPSGYIFDWDQYFEAILQRYAGFDGELIQNSLQIGRAHV